MKQIRLYIIVSVTMLFGALQTASATDFLLLETLIVNHKKHSDKLKERIARDAAVLGAEMLVETSNDEYEEVTKSLSARMGTLLTNASFVIEVGILTDRAIEAGELIGKAYSKAGDVLIYHPDLLTAAVQINNQCLQKIKDIAKIVALVITGGTGVSLATPEQRKQFCNMVRERIDWIIVNMNNLYRQCTMIEIQDKCNGNGIYNYDALDSKRMREIMFNRAAKRIENIKL